MAWVCAEAIAAPISVDRAVSTQGVLGDRDDVALRAWTRLQLPSWSPALSRPSTAVRSRPGRLTQSAEGARRTTALDVPARTCWWSPPAFPSRTRPESVNRHLDPETRPGCRPVLFVTPWFGSGRGLVFSLRLRRPARRGRWAALLRRDVGDATARSLRMLVWPSVVTCPIRWSCRCIVVSCPAMGRGSTSGYVGAPAASSTSAPLARIPRLARLHLHGRDPDVGEPAETLAPPNEARALVSVMVTRLRRLT